jgi:hypothetical protein
MSMAQAKLTPKQREMLLSFERDGEATDLCDFDSILGCRNQRKSNGGLRKAGRFALDLVAPPGSPCS